MKRLKVDRKGLFSCRYFNCFSCSCRIKNNKPLFQFSHLAPFFLQRYVKKKQDNTKILHQECLPQTTSDACLFLSYSIFIFIIILYYDTRLYSHKYTYRDHAVFTVNDDKFDNLKQLNAFIVQIDYSDETFINCSLNFSSG